MAPVNCAATVDDSSSAPREAGQSYLAGLERGLAQFVRFVESVELL
jgi:hypothetical protein